jgi:hypothetical protein
MPKNVRDDHGSQAVWRSVLPQLQPLSQEQSVFVDTFSESEHVPLLGEQDER